ncbi:Uu.00g087810.m01.CDS01 [Anthostomella pinea]|uniref:Small nuclear ribonucleoprotein Sm D3 n=1 Tax=Anthostomella pinea TaxID=933095 RepID=A0AAI8VME6_9PEZI|nr:Uu.00g087810.m01.CDS01 [Anthostomella pinea]
MWLCEAGVAGVAGARSGRTLIHLELPAAANPNCFQAKLSRKAALGHTSIHRPAHENRRPTTKPDSLLLPTNRHPSVLSSPTGQYPYPATMTSTIGIPIKLLNEAQGHIVTLEITSGQTYRGKLLEAEDNMNVQLKDITVTARDGRVSHLDQVYIRGSHVRFFIVPDMLKNAPMFRSRNARGRGVGLARGRATVSRARASGRGGRP